MTKQDIEIIARLLGFFEGNENKVYLWLNTDNPHFGHLKPGHLMKIGRGHRVLQFIMQAEHERADA